MACSFDEIFLNSQSLKMDWDLSLIAVFDWFNLFHGFCEKQKMQRYSDFNLRTKI